VGEKMNHQAIQGSYIDNKERLFVDRGANSVSHASDQEMVYLGPSDVMPRVVSERLIRKFGLEIFRHPEEIAWLMEVRFNGEIDAHIVGANVDEGWIIRYATWSDGGRKKFYLSEAKAIAGGIDVIPTSGARVLEIVHGEVEISIPRDMQMWINDCRRNWSD
jgi:hypothetical protein